MLRRRRKLTEIVHEGKFAAEVVVEFRYDENWTPTSRSTMQKGLSVRLALKRGDIAEASKYGRVFELTPVAAK